MRRVRHNPYHTHLPLHEHPILEKLFLYTEIFPYEKEFPFDFIHLFEKSDIMELDEELMLYAMEIIRRKKPFDYYIGYGYWGANLKEHGKSLAVYMTESYPSIKTINLIWDLHTLYEKESDCDIYLHGAPYHYIKHPKAEYREKNRTYLLPKQNSYTPIDKLDFNEWLSRPYDFIFNNPSIYKGSPLVINLALNFPDKKFLVKKGTWAIWGVYEWYYKWLEMMEKIPNIDIIDTVENMEEDFFRMGRYLLYPSVSEGFGLMPLEAAMQGTIPLCADTEILRFSSAPYADFIYSNIYTTNPIAITDGWSGGIDKIDWFEATRPWVERIKLLERNLKYTITIYYAMEGVEDFVEKRYRRQMSKFIEDIRKF